VEIYTPQDRMFLYTNIFPHVFPIEELKKHNENEVVDLTESFDNPRNCPQILVNMGYNNMLPYRTPEFLKLCNNIDVIPMTMNSPFCVLHFRQMYNYMNPLEDLEKLIHWVRRKGYDDNKIVVFWNTTNTHGLEHKYENIIITNNLHEYASYMSNNNCKMVVSEWSGGGQLSQYTTRGTIYYYFRNYPSLDYEKHYLLYVKNGNANDATIDSFWDWKNTTDAKVVMVLDFESLLAI
jgi:hypothetical protein